MHWVFSRQPPASRLIKLSLGEKLDVTFVCLVGCVFVLLAVSILALSTGACATIVDGTSQDISVTTVPGGATCEFERVGSVVGLIDATPGTIHVSKSKDSIVVT